MRKLSYLGLVILLVGTLVATGTAPAIAGAAQPGSGALLGHIAGCSDPSGPFEFDPNSRNDGQASTVIDVLSVTRETDGYSVDITNCAPTDLSSGQFPASKPFNQVLTICKFLNANHVVRGPEHTIDFGPSPLFDLGYPAPGSAFLPDESVSVAGDVIVLSVRCNINKIALDGEFIFDHPLVTDAATYSVVYFAFFETTDEGEVTPVDPDDPEYPDPEDIDFSGGSGCGFTDDDGNTHEDAIVAICLQEITQGCDTVDPALYCPSDLVTRAQMASFLARALNLDPGTGNTFTDDDGNTHEGNIEAIAADGITLGCDTTGTVYCPSDAVTRAQMASFLARAMGLTLNPNHGFSDVSGTHASAIGAVKDAGITLGCSATDPTLYCPDDRVRRDQMASFIARALDLLP